MNTTKKVKIHMVALSLATFMGAASPVIAGSVSEAYARQATGWAYGAVGTRVCGQKYCGRAGKFIGKRVFGVAQDITNRTGEIGRAGGLKIRKRWCRDRPCN